MNIDALEKAEINYNKLVLEKHKFTDTIETQFKASECWNKMQTLEMSRMKCEAPLEIDLKLKSHLQEEDAPPIMLGGDVIALYPSMETNPTAAVAYREIKRSTLKFKKINYAYGIVFLLLKIDLSSLDSAASICSAGAQSTCTVVP